MAKKNYDKLGCFSPHASLSPFRTCEEIHVALLCHVLVDLLQRKCQYLLGHFSPPKGIKTQVHN